MPKLFELIMVVTGDEFELPIAVFDKRKDVASFLHMRQTHVSIAIYRHSRLKYGPYRGCRIVTIPMSKEETR